MFMKQESDDRRDNIRIDFKVPVRLSFPGTARMLTGVLVNLSIGGMLVDLQDDIVRNADDYKGKCVADLLFVGKKSRLVIDELESTVVRIDDNMLAIAFTDPLEWFLLFNVYKDKQAND